MEIYKILPEKVKKILPEKVKKYIKKKLRIPRNVYQNVYTDIKINEYHSGKFDLYNNKFCLKDFHLNQNNQV